MIAIGYAVKKYPNLIAGYNTMSPERKKQVDIEGLSTFMKKGFIRMGLFIVVLAILFEVTKLKTMATLSPALIILGGTIAMVIVAQRYTTKNS